MYQNWKKNVFLFFFFFYLNECKKQQHRDDTAPISLGRHLPRRMKKESVIKRGGEEVSRLCSLILWISRGVERIPVPEVIGICVLGVAINNVFFSNRWHFGIFSPNSSKYFFGFIVLVITFQTAYNMSTFGTFVFEILACKHGGFCAEKRAFAGGDVALCFNEEIGCGNGSYSRGSLWGPCSI